MYLPITKARASGMMVLRLHSGVATQLAYEEPRAVYMHCYGHPVNLACDDTPQKS